MKNNMKIIIFVIAIFIVGILYKPYLPNRVKEDVETEKILKSQERIDTKELTLLQQYSIDIDGDNEEENVELYTVAMKDSKGEIMWDDGQYWLLLVKDTDGEFVLFNEYIQLGKIDMWVYTSDVDNKMHITTLQPGSASMRMYDYVFIKEKEYFERKTIFNPKNVNMIFQ
ncbi:hypothetical protein [Anaeromicrobium sediminis]|uniref:Uncharacterized protein n=1 Tax=Anaeromicrobium sediminis TaxID=1478221 RepID=A0A267MEM5_9FIRM|nr:hypothetical protein [Anaeromicrobium sediminis]PAB57378.1 hypothetical protein CCE28_18960 [Anaeromicrobium sediminis]